MGCEVRRQALGEASGVVGAPERLASSDGAAGLGVPSREVGMYCRSRKSSLSCRGRLSGVSEAGADPTARILKGPFQLRDSFFRLLYHCVGALFGALADCGGGVVDPGPTTCGEMRRDGESGHGGDVPVL